MKNRFKFKFLCLIIFLFALSDLAALSLGLSGGIKTTVYSVSDDKEFPVSEFLHPAGMNGRLYITDDISSYFSYGMLLQGEHNATKLDFYPNVYTLDLALLATLVIPLEHIEIPFTLALGGHTEFLERDMSWGFTALFETGLDWKISENHLLGFRTGAGYRFQDMEAASSSTWIVYPVSVSYTYRIGGER